MTDARNIAMLVSPAIIEYCRQARRLRHLHRGNPARLHRNLRELRPARRVEARRVEARRVEARRIGPNDFAAAVEARLNGPVLPYSRRQELIRIAHRLGIGRFEANLIIASVQHRAGNSAGNAGRVAARRDVAQRVAVFGAFVLVQSAIMLAIWFLLIAS